eukprot:g6820.t1
MGMGSICRMFFTLQFAVQAFFFHGVTAFGYEVRVTGVASPGEQEARAKAGRADEQPGFLARRELTLLPAEEKAATNAAPATAEDKAAFLEMRHGMDQEPESERDRDTAAARLKEMTRASLRVHLQVTQPKLRLAEAHDEDRIETKELEEWSKRRKELERDGWELIAPKCEGREPEETGHDAVDSEDHPALLRFSYPIDCKPASVMTDPWKKQNKAGVIDTVVDFTEIPADELRLPTSMNTKEVTRWMPATDIANEFRSHGYIGVEHTRPVVRQMTSGSNPDCGNPNTLAQTIPEQQSVHYMRKCPGEAGVGDLDLSGSEKLAEAIEKGVFQGVWSLEAENVHARMGDLRSVLASALAAHSGSAESSADRDEAARFRRLVDSSVGLVVFNVQSFLSSVKSDEGIGAVHAGAGELIIFMVVNDYRSLVSDHEAVQKLLGADRKIRFVVFAGLNDAGLSEIFKLMSTSTLPVEEGWAMPTLERSAQPSPKGLASRTTVLLVDPQIVQSELDTKSPPSGDSDPSEQSEDASLLHKALLEVYGTGAWVGQGSDPELQDPAHRLYYLMHRLAPTRKRIAFAPDNFDFDFIMRLEKHKAHVAPAGTVGFACAVLAEPPPGEEATTTKWILPEKKKTFKLYNKLVRDEDLRQALLEASVGTNEALLGLLVDVAGTIQNEAESTKLTKLVLKLAETVRPAEEEPPRPAEEEPDGEISLEDGGHEDEGERDDDEEEFDEDEGEHGDGEEPQDAEENHEEGLEGTRTTDRLEYFLHALIELEAATHEQAEGGEASEFALQEAVSRLPSATYRGEDQSGAALEEFVNLEKGMTYPVVFRGHVQAHVADEEEQSVEQLERGAAEERAGVEEDGAETETDEKGTKSSFLQVHRRTGRFHQKHKRVRQHRKRVARVGPPRSAQPCDQEGGVVGACSKDDGADNVATKDDGFLQVRHRTGHGHKHKRVHQKEQKRVHQKEQKRVHQRHKHPFRSKRAIRAAKKRAGVLPPGAHSSNSGFLRMQRRTGHLQKRTRVRQRYKRVLQKHKRVRQNQQRVARVGTGERGKKAKRATKSTAKKRTRAPNTEKGNGKSKEPWFSDAHEGQEDEEFDDDDDDDDDEEEEEEEEQEEDAGNDPDGARPEEDGSIIAKDFDVTTGAYGTPSAGDGHLLKVYCNPAHMAAVAARFSDSLVTLTGYALFVLSNAGDYGYQTHGGGRDFNDEYDEEDDDDEYNNDERESFAEVDHDEDEDEEEDGPGDDPRRNPNEASAGVGEGPDYETDEGDDVGEQVVVYIPQLDALVVAPVGNVISAMLPPTVANLGEFPPLKYETEGPGSDDSAARSRKLNPGRKGDLKEQEEEEEEEGDEGSFLQETLGRQRTPGHFAPYADGLPVTFRDINAPGTRELIDFALELKHRHDGDEDDGYDDGAQERFPVEGTAGGGADRGSRAPGSGFLPGGGGAPGPFGPVPHVGPPIGPPMGPPAAVGPPAGVAAGAAAGGDLPPADNAKLKLQLASADSGSSNKEKKRDCGTEISGDEDEEFSIGASEGGEGLTGGEGPAGEDGAPGAQVQSLSSMTTNPNDSMAPVERTTMVGGGQFETYNEDDERVLDSLPVLPFSEQMATRASSLRNTQNNITVNNITNNITQQRRKLKSKKAKAAAGAGGSEVGTPAGATASGGSERWEDHLTRPRALPGSTVSGADNTYPLTGSGLDKLVHYQYIATTSPEENEKDFELVPGRAEAKKQKSMSSSRVVETGSVALTSGGPSSSSFVPAGESGVGKSSQSRNAKGKNGKSGEVSFNIGQRSQIWPLPRSHGDPNKEEI